jgi:GntR family transcriptional regulator
MMLNRGPTPLYSQLKSILEEKIHRQEWKENDRLPSEGELCKQFKVSRITVRQALSELLKAGLIYRDRGRGTFITEGAGLKRPVLKGSIEDLIAAAKGTWMRVLSYQETALPPALAGTSKFDPSERVFQLEMVREIPKGPQGYSLIYFPYDLGKAISVEEFQKDTEIISFVEDKLGARAHRANQAIDVGVAGRAVARHLSVEPKTPLLFIRRDYYTRKGSLMFVAITYFRPDRFKYEIELTRT